MKKQMKLPAAHAAHSPRKRLAQQGAPPLRELQGILAKANKVVANSLSFCVINRASI